MTTSEYSRKLLILDLDETLIHARRVEECSSSDFQILGRYSATKRPHLDSFLDFCLAEFDVAVWSSASERYVEEVVCNVFPDPAPLAFVWTFHRCTPSYDSATGEICIYKHLRKVKRKGYSLQDILFLEDTPENLARSYGNVVPIPVFEGDPNDQYLKHLLPFLQEWGALPDVRVQEKRFWATSEELTEG